MIVYPRNWKTVGQNIGIEEIEKQLLWVVSNINCNCLSFSGGLDSSLLLYYLCLCAESYKHFSFRPIKVFTVGGTKNHPDIMFAARTVEYFRHRFKRIFDIEYYVLCLEDNEEIKIMGDEKFLGDNIVRVFYKWVSKHTDGIIAGDGIDEFACGYYAHQNNPTESVYYDFLRKLKEEHFIPLDKNSGDVMVYLPYINEGLISLFSQIPLKDKVCVTTRKKIMVKLAKGKVPNEVIIRRKYGFCDALKIKRGES